jgi:hypothetical protein
MTEPCTIEQLEAACLTLRAEAIAVGRTIEAYKIEGKTMRVIRGLETAHRAAWLRYYAVDNRLHEALHDRRAS